MMLTSRDKKILVWVEKQGSINISQCSKIFYKENKYAYYQARIRLKKLADNGFLKRFREDMKSETVYFIEKKLSFHNLKALDVYALLTELGADIKYFKRGYAIETISKQYFVDALIEYEYEGYFHFMIVEVDYTHFTSEKKLMDIYNSNYFQRKYAEYDEDIFPTVVILRSVIPVNKINTNLFNIHYMDMYLSNFTQVLL